jgi:hypothetical protein
MEAVVADLDLAFEQCLNAVSDGRSLQDVLRRYPGRRDDLIGLLQLSIDLGQLRPPAADPAFRLRARNRMLALAQRRRSLSNAPIRLGRRLRPVLLAAAGVAASLALLAGGVSAASSTSLPGEPLYGVKTAIERIQLTLPADPATRARLQVQFADRRLGEAQRLAQQGRVPEAVGLVDQYTTTIAAADVSAATGVQQRQTDQQLQTLATALSAAGHTQAAASVERARHTFDTQMAARQLPPAQAQQSPAPGQPVRGGAAAGSRAP